MISVSLIRFEQKEYTLGIVILPDQTFFSLEPPWKDNEINESCIPVGTYQCALRKSPKYGHTYWLIDTAPRSYILIHPGNIVKNTHGCILLGKSIGWITGQRAVLNSRSAVRAFEKALDFKNFNLEIMAV